MPRREKLGELLGSKIYSAGWRENEMLVVFHWFLDALRIVKYSI